MKNMMEELKFRRDRVKVLEEKLAKEEKNSKTYFDTVKKLE